MARRKNDFYPTPAWATEELLHRVDLAPLRVLEPCAGKGDMARVLKQAGAEVLTNDIDPLMCADHCLDARTFKTDFPTVITNPPFNMALDIVRNFVEQGCRCAFLLRLSFLEPTEDRGPWLADNPPSGLIVLQRISFTGDGKTDSVTCGWMLWNMGDYGVQVVPK